MAAILRVKDENGNIVSIPAIKGDKGEKGDRGLPGSGGVPDGGTTGQVLTKNSNANGDVGWKNSSGAEFSDDGSGNISVNGASSDAKRFLNSLTFPGLNYKYVNPINSGTYASPYGVYISSGTVIDYVVGLTQVGFYTAYVNRRVTDIPDAAKAANSSLRGFVCVSQIDNTASSGSQKCYAYIALIDQNSNFYIQYIQGSVGGGWKRMYPYETAESTLMEKLDKNQGTANSGKFLGIGADGIVVPTEVGGSGGSDRLIAKYVHSGNPVIQPTALDLTTGVFTCAGHGLTTGDTVMVIPDGSFATIPFELCSTLLQSTAKLTVGVIDANTFTLRNGSTDITYPNTNNTTVDVSKWHIEKSTIQIYRISGFSAKEIKVILSGFAWGSVNYYLNINAKDTSGYVKSRYGNNIGATCKNSCMLPPFYNIEVYFGNSTKMNAMNLNSSTTEADYKYIQQYPQFMGYGSRSKVESTFYVYALADHDDFIELKLNSASYDADNNLMLSNGFTVEVYRLG